MSITERVDLPKIDDQKGIVVNRLLKILGFSVGLWLLWASSVVYGVEVKGLYTAQIDVIDMEAPAFNHAAKTALLEVVVRVSGVSLATESQDVRDALETPDIFLRQYAYHKRQVDDTGLAGTTQFLVFEFDQTAINKLLRRAGLPIWASNRPEILLWLGVDNAGQRQLLSSSAMPWLRRLVEEGSKRRGLPISLPLLDLQDQSAVSVGDVWGMFAERVIDASERYQPSGVVLGKIAKDVNGDWTGRWMLEAEGQTLWQDSRSQKFEEVLSQAIDWVADTVGSRYAVVSTSEQADMVEIDVEGIHSLSDFAAATEYLENMVAVRRLSMVELKANTVKFKVYLEEDLGQLQQALRLDGKLSYLRSVSEPLPPLLSAEGPMPSEQIIEKEGVIVTVSPTISDVPISVGSPSQPRLVYTWRE